MVDSTWLNLIHSFICSTCKYEWIAPKPGNCPRCKSPNTILKDENPHFGPKRV